MAGGRRAASEFAELTPGARPTAVFCANDLIALGVLQELTLRGLRVPDDPAHQHRHVVFKPELVVRQSSAPSRTTREPTESA